MYLNTEGWFVGCVLENEMITKQKGERRSFLTERTLWTQAQGHIGGL